MDSSDGTVTPEYPELVHIILPPGRCTKRLLHATDIFLSLFVITPLVVAHWKGTWAIMDDNPEQFPPWLCFLFGWTVNTSFLLIKDLLHSEFTTPYNGYKSVKRILTQSIAVKISTYVFSLGCNMGWRGGFAVFDALFGFNVVGVVVPTIIASVLLIPLRCFRNMLAPPVVIALDNKDLAFSFPTRFRVEGSREPGLYVLDCVFSVLVVGTLVVIAWRGAWVFLDLFLYPENPIYSAWCSLAIGYGVVAITFAIQPIMRWTCDRITGFWRIAMADAFLLLSFVGTINVWRGVWQLLDIYFLPENRTLSNWLTHGLSFILLALLNCSNSVLVRGVYIDAEEPAGECVIFPIHYIRLFFQKERTKKQRRLLDALERQDQNNTAFLLDKSQINNIKIIKSNNNPSNILIDPATRPMLNLTNDRTKNGSEQTVTRE